MFDVEVSARPVQNLTYCNISDTLPATLRFLAGPPMSETAALRGPGRPYLRWL